MRRSIAVLATALFILALPATGTAQAPAEIGKWQGRYTSGGAKVAVRLHIDQLKIGTRAGTSRYVAAGHTCFGRLTTRARRSGGAWVLRDRRTSGPRDKCTTGDTLVVKASGDRMRVNVRGGSDRSALRLTLRRR